MKMQTVKIFLWLSTIAIGVQCESLNGKKLIVTTILEVPYVTFRESAGTNLTGNDRFEGYIVDLLDEISRNLSFEYTLQLSADHSYGAFYDGKWNGMIGELVDKRVDIAAAPMTITAIREAAVDFTVPFMNVGIGILCRNDIHFNNAEELANQDQVAFGCIMGGATFSFFRNANFSVYNKMWSRMTAETERSSIVQNSAEGIERVLDGNYAFIGESTAVEYAITRHCNLYQVGALLDSKGLGLAVPQGSPYREPLSHAILYLQESGVLARLKYKWWVERNAREAC